MEQERDVVVVGAGQAGMAMSHHLSKAGIDHVLLERGSFVGETWAKRYEGLKTITPNWMNSLPGLPFPGKPDEFATRDQVVDYLSNYAEQMKPPILFDHEVTRVTARGGGFVVETTGGPIRAGNVVAATGPFQVASMPAFAAKRTGFQIHSDSFISDGDLPEGKTVLVVGSGNSGIQIASDLSESRQVWLSRERDYSLPRRLTGQAFQGLLEKLGITDRRIDFSDEGKEEDLMWWMQHMGLYDMPPESPLGQVLANGVDPYIGQPIPTLASDRGISLVPRVTKMAGETVHFEDGTTLSPEIVIWATGYRFDYSWTEELSVTGDCGRPLQQDGISPVDGFYFLGLRWMRRADSGLLKGVGQDAALLTEVISGRIDRNNAATA